MICVQCRVGWTVCALFAVLGLAGCAASAGPRPDSSAGGCARRTETAVPPTVTAGHVSGALTGLVCWALFTVTGWTPLAWACVVLLLPVAGLGMGILLLGLPSPRGRAGERTGVGRDRSGERGRGGGGWVLVIAGHGIAAATLLLLVITATIGAG